MNSRSAFLRNLAMNGSRTSTYTWNFLLATAGVVAAQSGSDARSFAAAVQNINGMSSIFSLIPVLTGKVQNIKLIAVGMLLFSCELYRNVVGEFSYHHNEYVNVFSPSLIHIPTGTPERHASNVIINHNPSEDYMVEAWFQTQGRPAQVELYQTGNERTFLGMLAYMLIYSVETFLGVRTAATGTGIVLIGMQAAAALSWICAICVLQRCRGQGKRFIELNRLGSSEYRCFKLVTQGHNVHSAVFSIHLNNLQEFNIFRSEYQTRSLKFVGAAILVSAVIDALATILLVGLNSWAYGWLGYQSVILFAKVVFSLEPLREISIKRVWPMVNCSHPLQPERASRLRNVRLPMTVNSAPEFTFLEVCIGKNIVVEQATKRRWQSCTPGLYIGQPYFSGEKECASSLSVSIVRYLALSEGKLTLTVDEPAKEKNQALQREFLACLAEVTKANKVPSLEFVLAVETTMRGVRQTMDAQWFAFGTKDLVQYLETCKTAIIWRSVI
ncbi:hypothetical protein SCP_0106240 [Sparassis crispa]|uniref:Uncharacterized protein n=1 Tax=Sparassis crispa TaxID=139825 RepID=A0A401G6E9_9APHY|nr:hypothetical protein SCP_0106240 [Sparassis crispa]GBE77742.1 hypothetical protein SCP_0106240 [Sparassis crispa]